MNFYEFGIDELKQRGLFDSMAKEIMNEVVRESHENPNSMNRVMYDRWGENIDDYPPLGKILIFGGIEPFALEYIKKNCPMAWFRPIFDKDHPVRKEFDAIQNGVKELGQDTNKDVVMQNLEKPKPSIQIALVKNNLHPEYPKDKKFIADDKFIWYKNSKEIMCCIGSETANSYFTIVDMSATLEKICTQEIIQYTFLRGEDSLLITKEYFTKERNFKRSKTINDSINLYIELLSRGYTPVN